MRLLIDQGNTRVKWRLVDQAGKIGFSGAADKLEWAEIKASTQGFAPVNSIWVASVLGQERKQALSLYLAREFNCPANFAQVEASCLGVKPAYNDRSKLGVDRWLGFLSAYRVCRQVCVVVSAGTAITVDFVNDQGQHLGGLIFPGAALMAEALRHKSGALQSSGLAFPRSWSPGSTTYECIESGLAAGIAGFAQQVETYVASQLKGLKPPAMFVTGGDAELFSGYLSRPHQVCEGLVLDGLYLVSLL